MRPSIRIPTTAQLRQLEADWIKQCGPSWGQVLMEIAGRSAAQEALKLWHNDPGLVSIFCGRGNNGGDGMVVARYLHIWGVPVSVCLVDKSSDAKMSTEEGQVNRKILEKLGVEIVGADHSPATELTECTLVVDALFGTGLDRKVEAPFRAVIDAINCSGKTVLSVDIPSGINSDNGKIMGVAVRADHTVTFGYLKPGLLSNPGAGLSGDLTIVDIGLPELSWEQDPVISLITCDYVRALLPARPSESNKGTYGTVLTIAGSLGMSGATLLASDSALRVGAGLALLATPKSLVIHLPPTEVIYIPIDETKELSISSGAIKDLEPHLEKTSAIVLGPGLSTHDDTVKFVHEFVSKTLPDVKKPCIIDADALNAIAKNTKAFPKQAENIVITPHPKELSRLTEVSVQDIQADRIKAAKEAAEKFGCVVVLKGSHTIVAGPHGDIFINPTGNPGMATAGAGDVLSGIIGGLLAQGLTALDAAVAGVYIHGTAGDLAALECGESGVIASDIMNEVPYAIANIEKGELSDLEHQIIGTE